MKYPGLGIRMRFVIFAMMFATACQRAPAPPPSPAVGTQASRTLDLATRLQSLSTVEQNSVRRLLTNPGSTDTSEDARLVGIARDLCHLTLTEANELGIRLDTEQSGAVSEFALVPLQRQTWALDQILQIEARMTKEISPQYAGYAWSAGRVTENRDPGSGSSTSQDVPVCQN